MTYLVCKKTFKVDAQKVVCRHSTPLLPAKNRFAYGLASRWNQYVLALFQCLFFARCLQYGLLLCICAASPKKQSSFPSMKL